MPEKLTKKFLEGLTADKPTGVRIADTELPGFGVAVYPAATVFEVRVRVGRRRRRLKIGRFGPLTVDEARKKARELLSQATLGHDPVADRDKVRSTPSWGEWVKTYLERVSIAKKSARDDIRYLGHAPEGKIRTDRYHELLERWRHRPVNDISRGEIDDFRTVIGKKHRTEANRFLASVRKCLADARAEGHLAINPAADLKAFPENPPRVRVLNDDEMKALISAVAREDPWIQAAFHLLVETGARQSEVLAARWRDFDLQGGTWRIPSPKSGTPQLVPLATTTIARLKRLPHDGDFVVPGRTEEGSRYDLKEPWSRIKSLAQLSRVTIHDVRRTFGLAIAKKAGLHIASKLLRHSDIRVTQRVYAPLDMKDLKRATERHARVLRFGNKKTA